MQVGRINTSVNNDLENVVKVKKCGNIVEVICNNQKAKGGSVKKLNDDYYIDVKSGEVKAFEKISSSVFSFARLIYATCFLSFVVV